MSIFTDIINIDSNPSHNQTAPEQNNVNPMYDALYENYGSHSNNFSSVQPGNDVTATAPIDNYQIYTDEVPQSVIDAQANIERRSIPTQEYADQVQADLIADYHGYRTDKDYKGRFSAQEANDGYKYLSTKNNNSADINWTVPIADDDLFTQIAPRWDAARELRESASAEFNAPLPTREEQFVQNVYNNPNLTQAQRDVMDGKNIPMGDWNTLGNWDKFLAMAMPGGGEEEIPNLPDWAKYIEPIFPSTMAGGAGAAVGSVFGPGGALVGYGLVSGLSYLQGVTNVEIPVINELLYGMDILSIWAEKAQGAIGSSLKTAWDKSMEDGTTDLFELGKTMGEVLQDFPDLWEIGSISYEVGADAGMDNVLNYIRNAGAKASNKLFGTDFEITDTNTVSRANRGLGGTFDVNPEIRGYDALGNVYLPLYRSLRDEAIKGGYGEKEAREFAIRNIEGYINSQMGTTGMANDFAASSLIDPLNVVPYVQAKTGEVIGKATGDTSLMNASKAAQHGSSLIVDAFSVPVLEQVAEFVTGKHATQGMSTIIKNWANELQTKPVDSLNGFQKRLAGINNDGLIKNLAHETNPVKKWFGLTDEAKMYRASEYITNMLGSILFGKDIDENVIPELISQFAGISPITDDSPLAGFRDSAMLKTIQQTMTGMDVSDINRYGKQMDTFRQYNANRMMANTVAEKLNMKPDQLFKALDDDALSYQLQQKIQKADITWTDPTSGMVWNPDQVYDAIKVFANDGKSNNHPYYSLDMMKANIMESIMVKADKAMFRMYPDIKPDKWYNRLSKMMNSAQSIALLNFSPSYFVNNALNNILTRSVVGVGGIDTGRIKTASERRGLKYSREEGSYKTTEDAINYKHRDPKDGLFQRAKDIFDKVADSKILKGVNNIDFESVEKRAAFEIGANRYWEATWKPGMNIPEIPNEWKAFGFDDAMATEIYKIAMDCDNISEFREKMMKDVIIPGAKSTFETMLNNSYNDADAKVIEDTFASMPWVAETLNDAMKTGNPDVIKAAFNEVRKQVTNDIDLQNLAQLSTEFEDLVTKYAGEGVSAFSTESERLFDLYCQVWMDQTLDMESMFADRILKHLSEDEMRPIYEEHLFRMQQDYYMVRQYQVQNAAAMIVGLGLNDDVAKALMINVLQQFDSESLYMNEEHELFMKYGDRHSKDYDFDYYRKAKLEMIGRVFADRQKATKQYDQVIIDYLRNNLDETYTARIDAYEKEIIHQQQLKAELDKKNIEWLTERLHDYDIAHKDKVARVDPNHNKQRMAMKQEILTNYQKVIAPMLQELEGCFEKRSSDKVKLTVGQTLALELLYKEAERFVEDANEYLYHYVDKSKPFTSFEPISFANSTLEGSFFDNARKNAAPDVLERIRERYESGDSVPLGSVDPRKTAHVEEPVFHSKYSDPVGTMYVDENGVVYNSETGPDNIPDVPFTAPAQSDTNSKLISDIEANSVVDPKLKFELLDAVKTNQPITNTIDNARNQLKENITKDVRKIVSRYKSLDANEKSLVIDNVLAKAGIAPDDGISDAAYDSAFGKLTKNAQDKINKLIESGETSTGFINDVADRYQPMPEGTKTADTDSAGKTETPQKADSAIPEDTADTSANPKKTAGSVPEETEEVLRDTFTPINPDFIPGESKITLVKSEPFKYGDSIGRAAVYYEGELIAYITDDIPDMIQAGPYEIPVIGRDVDDPNSFVVFINDEPQLVTPGKPKDVTYSVFAETGEHPMRYGTSPSTEKWGEAAWETSLPIREALNRWEATSMEALFHAPETGSALKRFSPVQQKMFYDWVNKKLAPAYNYQRFASQRYGNTMVDLSVLNYNDRHGFDSALTAIMPYQYWMTRSILNWGARMIDQPKWFSMYARYNKLVDRNSKDFIPTRLRGATGIPLAFMPEGLGNGLFFDPSGIALPHKQFYDAFDYFRRDLHTIHLNTLRILDEHYLEGVPYNGHLITEAEYNEARTGYGEIYAQMFNEARQSDESDTGLSGLVGSMINPNMTVSSVLKALEGKQDTIPYTPMYKLGNTVRAAGRNTVAEKVTNLLGDALQFTESKWRDLLGAESNETGNRWQKYWVMKYLADMLYDKTATRSEVTNAIAEGESNPLYQLALERYSQSEAYKQQGGALLSEVSQSLAGNKETSAGQIAGMGLVSLFGGKTFTTGEDDFRWQRALNEQYKDDPAAREKFFELYPDYKVGFYASEDDDAVRLHKILVDNCYEAFYALPETQQDAVYWGLDDQFRELFINKDTRSTDDIPDDTLIEWTQAMHGNVPNIGDFNKDLDESLQLRWYVDSIEGLTERFETEKKKYFPGIDETEQGLYKAPDQEAYKAKHPELQQYWNWCEKVGMANPKLGTYIQEQKAKNKVRNGTYQTITDAVYAQFRNNNGIKKNLENYEYYGYTLQGISQLVLEQLVQGSVLWK